MIAFVLAAAVCSIVTLVLNAHYGWTMSSDPFYAAMFAALSVAFDITKSTSLVAASRAWRTRAYGVALICFVLFWPTFAYSLHAGIAQIAKDRAAAATTSTNAVATKGRLESQHARLSAELKLMQQSPTFAATSACALPKSNEAKAFCAKADKTAADLDRLSKELSVNTAVDAEPQNTLFAAFTGWDMARLKLTLALWPILLAELTGALGFYLADRLRSVAKPVESPQNSRELILVTEPATDTKNAPASDLGRSGSVPSSAPLSPSRTPTLVWPETPS